MFLYQLLGTLVVTLMPLSMLLGILWIIIKMGKGFVRSITK